jgi:RHS repeat-associated protein
VKFTDFPNNRFEFKLGYEDTTGRVASLTYPARISGARRTLVFKYAKDVPFEIDLDSTAIVTGLQFGPDGRITTMQSHTPAGPVNWTYTSDPVTGLAASQTVVNVATGQPISEIAYKHQRSEDIGSAGVTGQLTVIQDLLDGSRTQNFFYDKLGRLTAVARGTLTSPPYDPKTLWTNYSYDRFGNRYGVHAFRYQDYPCDGQEQPLCAIFDADITEHDGLPGFAVDPLTNRISAPGFAYDAAGNLIKGRVLKNGVQQDRLYQYDAAGRLTKSTSGNTVEIYRYGFGKERQAVSGDGIRWRYSLRFGGKELTRFVTNASVPPSAFWDSDSFYLGDRKLFSESLDSPRVIYVPDQRGTLLSISSKSGTLSTTAREIKPFGSEATSTWTGEGDSARFTSYDRSYVSGLDYAINRYFDSGLGRFLTTDPAHDQAIGSTDPQGLNGYSYARNDPINLQDPDGRHWKNTWACVTLDGETFCQWYTDWVGDPPTPAGTPPNTGNPRTSNVPSGPGSGDGGAGKSEDAPNTKKQLWYCRNTYLNNNYTPAGASVIKFFSPFELGEAPKEWASSAIESAIVKGSLLALVPRALKFVSAESMKDALEVLESGYQSYPTYEALLDEAFMTERAVRGIRAATPKVGQALLAAGVFATVQDVGALIHCGGAGRPPNAPWWAP